MGNLKNDDKITALIALFNLSGIGILCGGCDLETVPLCCWRFASYFPWVHHQVPLGCGVRPTPPGGARGDGDSPPQVFTRPLSSAGSRRCIPVLPDHLRPITASPTLTHLRDTHALISWIDQGIEGSRVVPGCPSPRTWHSPVHQRLHCPRWRSR